MADASFGGIVLPNLFPAPGQVFQQAIAQKERQSERDEIRAEREYQKQQQNEWKSAQLIERKSDPSKYHTGLQQFDTWVDTKVADLIDKYSSDPAYKNPEALLRAMAVDFVPFIQGHNLVKNKITSELQSVSAIVAQNKWVDKDALTRDVYNRVASHFFHPDQNGEFTFKPIDQVNPNINFAAELIDSPDGYKYVNDAAIDEFNKNITNAPEETRNYLLRNPDGSIGHFKGKLSPYETENVQPDAKGFVSVAPKYTIATEGRTDENGNPLNTLSPEVIETYMANTTGRKMAMQRLLGEQLEQQGIDVTQLSPQELMRKQQEFAYSVVKASRNNQPDLFSYNQPPKTTNNININGKPTYNYVWAAEASDALRSLDRTAINNAFGKLFAGNGPLKYKTHSVEKITAGDKGKYDVVVTYINTNKKDDDGKPVEETTRIDLRDPNLGYKLQGLEQGVFGSDKADEDLLITPSEYRKKNLITNAPGQQKPVPQKTKKRDPLGIL